MTSLSVFDLLSLHSFVADLPSGWLHRLATAGRPVLHPAGTRLFREDAVADRFWLLTGGVVAIDFHVPGRGDIVVERVGAGDVLGWSWSRPPHRWRFGAMIAEDMRAVELDARVVRELMVETPDLGLEFGGRLLDVVARRLQAARHRLVELYAYPSGPH
ncbi:cyclic nucleotide-binding domain-containing protein [Actinoplanes sp. LDG1-06]|uniref:Cyclic nucleotide-binding domain-containing protein n=1 Tax=Paractinoplanes ovalisporus TaxID=2810368 RepID=A0ABS2A922_9ACTN|nr:cyclic nucleotide-binding domain-containing protein [Actinoplanes ovalisporus]MBM2616317.1 cyclic nucleotide-binding domain-containing protein [Actinoplanes ovalisporus]